MATPNLHRPVRQVSGHDFSRAVRCHPTPCHPDRARTRVASECEWKLSRFADVWSPQAKSRAKPRELFTPALLIPPCRLREFSPKIVWHSLGVPKKAGFAFLGQRWPRLCPQKSLNLRARSPRESPFGLPYRVAPARKTKRHPALKRLGAKRGLRLCHSLKIVHCNPLKKPWTAGRGPACTVFACLGSLHAKAKNRGPNNTPVPRLRDDR